jgi:hypothetical protein
MTILTNEKDFSLAGDIELDIIKARDHIKQLGLNIGDNVFLICHALEKTKHLNGCYLECGVFRGSTILTSRKFCEIRGIDKNFYGADSFEGFPEGQTTNSKDSPEAFLDLYQQGKITKEHLDLSKKRIENLDRSHLDSEYFSNPGRIIFEQAPLQNIKLLKGPFEKTLSVFNEPISVMHLDCDLYEPYMECLRLQYRNVVKGGFVVFDEYYSHKYPGARIAVDEFLSTLDKSEYDLLKFNTGNFERWCVVKL